MSSHKIGPLERATNSSQEVNNVTEFNLIYKYWTEKAPLNKIVPHKKALEKFIKKQMKGSLSLGETTVSDYSGFETKKSKKKKKMIIKQESDQTNSPLKEKNNPLKSQKSLNNDIENIESLGQRKKKFKNENAEQLFNTNKSESINRIPKKKKRKSNLSITTDEQSNIDTSFISSTNKSISETDNQLFESPERKNLKKKKMKKSKLMDAKILHSNINDVKYEDQNVNESISVDNSTLKIKKKKFQMDISKTSFDDEAVLEEKSTKKKRKKRPLSETEISDANEFNNAQSPTNKRPQKKQKKESNTNKFNNEIEQHDSEILKMKKKKKKKMEIVPGLDSQPELTKFLSKLSDDEIEDSDDDDDNKVSFPRTPLNKKYDPEEKIERTLYVGNLPTDITKETLAKVFKVYGKVESARVRGAVPIKPSIPQKVASFKKEFHKDVKSLCGFVVFATKEDAEKALVLNGQVFNGNHLQVNKERKKSNFNDKTSVFLGHLPYDIDDDSVRDVFTDCGKIDNIQIIRDKSTGRSKGFGFIKFQDKSSAISALNFNGTELNGIQIRVVEYTGNPEKKEFGKSPQFARNRLSNQGNKSTPKKFFKKKFKDIDGQDSGPRKTFKKIKKKKQMEKEKKKIASLFKNK